MEMAAAMAVATATEVAEVKVVAAVEVAMAVVALHAREGKGAHHHRHERAVGAWLDETRCDNTGALRVGIPKGNHELVLWDERALRTESGRVGANQDRFAPIHRCR